MKLHQFRVFFVLPLNFTTKMAHRLYIGQRKELVVNEAQAKGSYAVTHIPISVLLTSMLVRLRRSVAGVAMSIAVTLMVSLPLYLIGYQNGLCQVVGLVLSGLLGPPAMIVTVGLLMGARSMDIVKVIAELWRRFPEVSLAVPGTALAVMGANYGYIGLMGELLPEPVTIYGLNAYAHWFKPIGHVSSLAILFFALCPAMMVAVPAALRSRCALETAYWATRALQHNKTYSMWVMFTLFVVAAAMAQTVYVGVVMVPAAAALGAVLSDRVFKTRA